MLGDNHTCQIHSQACENVEEEKPPLQAKVFALLLAQAFPYLQWLELLQVFVPVAYSPSLIRKLKNGVLQDVKDNDLQARSYSCKKLKIPTYLEHNFNALLHFLLLGPLFRQLFSQLLLPCPAPDIS